MARNSTFAGSAAHLGHGAWPEALARLDPPGKWNHCRSATRIKDKDWIRPSQQMRQGNKT
jgi:hypothetical protein